MNCLRNWAEQTARFFKTCYWRVRLACRYNMTTRIDFQKYPETGQNPPAMCWTACHPATMPRFKAILRCPDGHVLTLKNHEILLDGCVVPSVVCTDPGCQFHAHVRLAGWTFGNIP